MPNNLLLLAYPVDDDIHTSFMYSSSREYAEHYTGNAEIVSSFCS